MIEGWRGGGYIIIDKKHCIVFEIQQDICTSSINNDINGYIHGSYHRRSVCKL